MEDETIAELGLLNQNRCDGVAEIGREAMVVSALCRNTNLNLGLSLVRSVELVCCPSASKNKTP